jgi:hypothetical protein
VRLTVIADGRRLDREFSPEGLKAAAAVIEQHREHFESVSLTVLVHTDNNVTHIVCRRPPLR